MNKDFVVKILKLKQMEYIALKEILPVNLRKRLDSFENETTCFLMDVAMELFKDNIKDTKVQVVKKTKKVEVDFS